MIDTETEIAVWFFLIGFAVSTSGWVIWALFNELKWHREIELKSKEVRKFQALYNLHKQTEERQASDETSK